MNYAAKPSELDQNPRAPELLIQIANGNQDALRWMWSLWCFTHLYDDLVDKDKKVTADEASSELCRFIEQMTLNKFYRDNASGLLALLVSALNRWQMGDEMAKSSDSKQIIMARAVRCGDVDLYLHVAYLTGGWEHMRSMSALMGFDKE